ncbi:uncharacterized protein LOC125353510 [Perognathus longimembris pacificus]|uniref:uncharacterized protein LOC125353510 n=1 Tax=Perognathus longimembris pacificus TaxID=214514 RepID=UPI00201900C6|nr:uncharacterized protein LOC125353510 [Perognathus longimembris pacificus]
MSLCMPDTPGLFGGRGFCPIPPFTGSAVLVPSPQLLGSYGPHGWFVLSSILVSSLVLEGGLGTGGPPPPSPFSRSPSPFSPPYNSCSRPGVGWGGLGEGARIRGMDQPMKGAGGEQKGGGWEEEEGEGVRANRHWRPHKDWPRTEEDREVGGNWGGRRGDPLLTCPGDRPPPGSHSPSPEAPVQAGGERRPVMVSSCPVCLFIPCPQWGSRLSLLGSPLLSVLFLSSRVLRRPLSTFHARRPALCVPHPRARPVPGGPRPVRGAPAPAWGLPPPPGPRLLIVQTQFSSLWLRPRVESGRPEPPPPDLEGERGSEGGAGRRGALGGPEGSRGR